MAKAEKGKIKIRFFEVELEGSDETLLESVRSAASLANRVPMARQIKQLQAAPAINGTAGVGADVTRDFGSEESGEPEELEVVGTAPRPKKSRTYATLNVVEIDLKSGNLPFADFATEKAPGDTTKRFLVAAAWLKEQRGISTIDAHHVYTCFRHMNWGIQKDMNQPLRDAARSGYFKKIEKGKFEITHIGLDAVQKMNSAA